MEPLIGPYKELYKFNEICEIAIDDNKDIQIPGNEDISAAEKFNSKAKEIFSQCKDTPPNDFKLKNVKYIKQYLSKLIDEHQQTIEDYKGWTTKWFLSLFIPYYKSEAQKTSNVYSELVETHKNFNELEKKIIEVGKQDKKERSVTFSSNASYPEEGTVSITKRRNITPPRSLNPPPNSGKKDSAAPSFKDLYTIAKNRGQLTNQDLEKAFDHACQKGIYYHGFPVKYLEHFYDSLKNTFSDVFNRVIDRLENGELKNEKEAFEELQKEFALTLNKFYINPERDYGVNDPHKISLSTAQQFKDILSENNGIFLTYFKQFLNEK